MRLVLRNAFQLAMESEDTEEYIRMTEIYSSGCMRLVRLLKIEQAAGVQLEAYLQAVIEEVILDLNKELGLM